MLWLRINPFLPIALLLLCSFFINTFTSSIVVRFVLTAASVVLAILISFERRIRYVWNWPMASLLLLWAIALFNQNHDIAAGDYSWLFFFSATLLVTITLGFGEGLSFCKAVKFVALLGLFFALATIAMWLYPLLFDVVKEFFFSSSISARSYRNGFTAHYSTNAIYITFGIICMFALLVNEGRKKFRYLEFIGLVACFFALFLTTKRTHLAIAIVACMSMYLLSGDKRLSSRMTGLLAWGAAALAVFSIAAQYIPELSMTIDRIIGLSDDDTFGSRSDLYSICINLWKSSPIVGNGWGSFTEALYNSPAGARFAVQGYFEIDAHNVFLQILAESGLVGLCIFLAWSVGSLIQTGRLTRSSEIDATYKTVVTAAWGVQLFFLVYCFTGNPLYDPQMFIPFLLIGFGGYLHCWSHRRISSCQASNGTEIASVDSLGVICENRAFSQMNEFLVK